ncbi:efflux RND transporter periplasmic adaptor subunit [Methylocapsa palsarum]|uniref:Membrane fusion protein, multidrug efflux system n=1 Tax=Methylocapsa palsarum TaxID=1612308 RepID=A0A1I3ZNU0_9HYPH|nr:efflux RND transporter periplasmic adaptor subunit [Methylocapsa palsarum]SFK45351.1 membrane fusion protein, multidrug efflux system [Methylocapsa palsarum]
MDDRTRSGGAGASDESFLREEDVDRLDAKRIPFGPAVKPRSRLRPVALLGLIILLGLAVYRIANISGSDPDKAESSSPPPQPVAAATIATGDVKVVVNALGAVTPISTVTVKPRVSGHLLEVAYKEGQLVKKGEFLAQIDPRPFELAEQQYEGQLLRDQGLLDQARTNLVRYQTLVKQASIARQQAEDQVFLVKQYEGSVKSDQAQIDNEKLNLTYAHVVSPIDGRVGLRLVDAGNYVQTTDSGIAVITQLNPISVIFTVPEDDLPQIVEQLQAGATLDATAFDRANITRLAAGKVTTLDNQIDTSTGMVKLRAEFQNPDNKLFPNQFVNVRLLVRTMRGVVTVPTNAIQHGAPGAYVYLIGADGKVTARPVELGPTDGPVAAVRSGLSAGDRVVIEGADRLREGASVTIPADADGSSEAAQPNGGGGRGNRARRSAP